MRSYSPYQFAVARILTGGLAVGIGLLAHETSGIAAWVSAIFAVVGFLLLIGLRRRASALCALGLPAILVAVSGAESAITEGFLSRTDPNSAEVIGSIWIIGGIGLLAPFLILSLAPAGDALRIRIPKTPGPPWLRNALETLCRSRPERSPWSFPWSLAALALAFGATLAGLLVLAALSSPPGLDPTKPATLAGDAMTTASAATGAIGISPGDFDVARFLLWYAAALLLFTGLNLAWILPPRPAPAFAIAIAIASEETRDAGVASPPIVFFDGVCGLCNTAVDFILAEDRPGIFRYAPLQGETAARLLSPEAVADMDSMVFRDARGEFHTRSEAILRIGIQMGGLWRLGAPGLLIPRALRDRLYSTIAKNRYRWFGKKESCRMPTPKERELFLM